MDILQENAVEAHEVRELSASEIETISGGRINLNGDKPRHAPQEPTGGAGYTGIMIHYTLTVIE